MTTTTAKSTSQGQVTLPKKWRSQFNTDTFKVTILDRKIIYEPLELDAVPLDEEGEVTVWDAQRDNNGVGMTPEEFLHLIKKARNG